MSTKSKGTRYERELFHMFWNNGFVAIRTAGSGSTPMPAPDLIASNSRKIFAVECKAVHSLRKYFPPKEINELNEFSRKFGAEPYIAIRFDRKGWFFVHTNDLSFSKTNYYISFELAETKGKKFEEIIN